MRGWSVKGWPAAVIEQWLGNEASTSSARSVRDVTQTQTQTQRARVGGAQQFYLHDVAFFCRQALDVAAADIDGPAQMIFADID